jgi:lipoprotein-releasing system ATP-binding protein
MLATKQIEYGYPGGQPMRFPDIEIAKGQPLLVLGRSGIGKSTLLHLLGLILAPHKGQITINGQDTARLSAAALPTFRAQNIGMVFQKAHFVSSLSALDNLLLANYLAKKNQDSQRAEQLLSRMGIASHKLKPTQQLSIGEQQRLGIARALMNQPPLLLADEPTSALDDASAAAVADLLLEQSAAENTALVIVTHDARLKSKFSQTLSL